MGYIIAYAVDIFPNPPASVTVTVNSTGLTLTAVSTFFIKRARDRGEGFTWRHWLKWTVSVEVMVRPNHRASTGSFSENIVLTPGKGNKIPA